MFAGPIVMGLDSAMGSFGLGFLAGPRSIKPGVEAGAQAPGPIGFSVAKKSSIKVTAALNVVGQCWSTQALPWDRRT